jgi:hypothetical protein
MEIRNRVYIFETGDKCFEQFEEVYKLSYVANLQFVLHEKFHFYFQSTINFVIKV